MKQGLKDKIYGCLAGGLIGDAMGAPVENWHYSQIKEKYGSLEDFEGEGTDDSAIKLILCDALIEHDGDITADEFAVSFLKHQELYYDLFYIPVKNMFHKLQDKLSLPIYAGIGNMQSSSSAMSISPMGIINACDPQRAAIETFDVAGLIHAGDTTFCRDAACAMAAAVAEAMKPDATVDSVLEASVKYLHKTSSAVMAGYIEESLSAAKRLGSYEKYREWVYENKLQSVICDSRETVPAALALFALAGGNATKAIIYSANFGRDADTIATMAGALAGAYGGSAGLRDTWMDKVERNSSQKKLTDQLTAVVRSKKSRIRQNLQEFDRIQE